MIIIQCVPSGPLQTNAYLLACSETREGVIIDPAPGSSEPLIEKAKGIHIRGILLTHSHWDHIADVKKVKAFFDAPVFVHPADRGNVICPGSDRLFLPIPIEGVEPDYDLHDQELIIVGHLKVKVLGTPGHTPGGVCFYLEQEKVLFSGDTLFKGSFGTLSFPTSNAEAMWASLKQLNRLPSETVVYPGHGASTTIGAEKWLAEAERLFS